MSPLCFTAGASTTRRARGRKKGGWRELSWEMSEPDAAEWAKKNGFDRIEKVPGSEKCYKEVDGR
jgi:hypothetical protein